LKHVAPQVVAIVAAAAIALIATSCNDTQAQLNLTSQWSQSSQAYPHMRVAWPSHQIELSKSHRNGGPYATGQAGTLHITFVVLNDKTPSTTSGSLDLPLRSDWTWDVDFFISDSNPILTCLTCSGSDHYDLDPALGYGSSMQLYVVWGGSSISNPSAY
jgi:hypothetical protein